MKPGDIIVFLVPVVLIILLFRSQRRRQQAATQVQSSVAPGAEVFLTSGLYGKVVEVLPSGDVVIEPSPGVHLRFDRRAVSRVVPSGEPPAIETAGD